MEGMTAFNEYQTSGDIHGKLVELLDPMWSWLC